MREIVLDTETTGLSPKEGHRLVEIGCLELINYLPTGNVFHVYINPERDMPAEAFKIHGLSDEFLSDKPVFKDVAQEFLDFISDSRLIIHNASFDMNFLRHEMKAIGVSAFKHNEVLDTLLEARKKHPGSPNSLDALCRRYNIDNSNRTLHGALLDSELLAEVYLELIGGRQPDLTFAHDDKVVVNINQNAIEVTQRPEILPERLSEVEKSAHKEFVRTLGDAPIWKDYL